jgi:hypothetical protein
MTARARKQSRPVPAPPPVGARVRLKQTDSEGHVTAHLFGEIYVRPIGGGVEWSAPPEDVERIPDA